MKYQAVIFDLDGTLLNTLDDLMESANYALECCHMPVRTYEHIRRSVGNGAKRLIELSVPEGTDSAKTDEVFDIFREHYNLHCNDKTDLYPGIRELLAELKARGVPMAIVSNKYWEGVQNLKEQYFRDYLDIAIGEKEGLCKKPAPDMVFEALRLLGVSKENAVYIGDSEVDIATAANCEMDCIAVGWGFRTRDEQIRAGAKIFAEEPRDIVKMFS